MNKIKESVTWQALFSFIQLYSDLCGKFPPDSDDVSGL